MVPFCSLSQHINFSTCVIFSCHSFLRRKGSILGGLKHEEVHVHVYMEEQCAAWGGGGGGGGGGGVSMHNARVEHIEECDQLNITLGQWCMGGPG